MNVMMDDGGDDDLDMSIDVRELHDDDYDLDDEARPRESAPADKEYEEMHGLLNQPKGNDDRIWEKVFSWLKSANKKRLKEFALLKDKDNLERTALHKVCARNGPSEIASLLLDVAPEVIFLADAQGMTPLHLACQYCVAQETASTLAEASSSPKYFTATDKLGRTPLHVAMDQASRRESVTMVRLLLKGNRGVKMKKDNQNRYPLSCLIDVDTQLNMASVEQNVEERRKNVLDCFDAYVESISLLDYHSDDDPDKRFFLLLGILPDWILNHAAMSSPVQLLVNKKACSIATVANTTIYFLCLVAILVGLQSIWSSESDEYKMRGALSAYIGASLIILSKCARLVVRLYKGEAVTFIRRHPSDLLDFLMGVLVVFLSLRFAFHVLPKVDNDFHFVWNLSSVVCIGLAHCGVISFFRFVSVDFAVLTDAVLSTAWKIMTFMVAFTILILAFAQMMMIATIDTNECTAENSDFCTLASSLMKTYTMSVGEVSEDDIAEQWLATALFVLFVYCVVVLMTNILAFIIGNDIWRKEDTEREFWLNRIQVLSDRAIFEGFDMQLESKMSFVLKGLWRKLASVLQNKRLSILSIQFWQVMLLRVGALFVMFFWIVIGLLSFGVLWPPQVREFLFWVQVKMAKKPTTGSPDQYKGSTSQKISIQSTQFVEGLASKQARREEFQAMKEDIKKLERKLNRLLVLMERQGQNAGSPS